MGKFHHIFIELSAHDMIKVGYYRFIFFFFFFFFFFNDMMHMCMPW